MIELIPMTGATTSTGNNTHEAVRADASVGHRVAAGDAFAFEMEVTAIGATPTVTWQVQGSLDGTNWYDVAYVSDANDTVATAARVATVVGTQVQFLSNPAARQYAYWRVVTSLNLNVTYTARMRRISKP